MHEFKVVHENEHSYVVRLRGEMMSLFKSPNLINITNGAVFYAEYRITQEANGNVLTVIELLSGETLDQLPVVQI